MDKKQILDTLKKIKETSPKRNFKQSVDLIINLKGIDLKKPEQQVNLFVPLPHDRGRKSKICAFVGPELLSHAKEACDGVVSIDDFNKYGDKKKIKKLANDYDFFISQINVMPQVAATFGRVLGPKGKMPNPKAGCVVPPNANLKMLYDGLQKNIKVATKNDPIIQCSAGKEDMKDDEIAENIASIYNAVIHALPNEANNIKSAFLKLTMGKAVEIGGAEKEEKTAKKKSAKQKLPEKAEKIQSEPKQNEKTAKRKQSGKKQTKEK